MKRLGFTLLACTFLALFSAQAQEKKKVTKQETVKETTKTELPSASEKNLEVPVGSKTPPVTPAPKAQEPATPQSSEAPAQAETPVIPQTVEEVEEKQKSADKPVNERVLDKKKKAKKSAKQKTPATGSKK